MPSSKQLAKVEVNHSDLAFIAAFKTTFGIPCSSGAFLTNLFRSNGNLILCYAWDILCTMLFFGCSSPFVFLWKYTAHYYWQYNFILDLRNPTSFQLTHYRSIDPSRRVDVCLFAHSSLKKLRLLLEVAFLCAISCPSFTSCFQLPSYPSDGSADKLDRYGP